MLERLKKEVSVYNLAGRPLENPMGKDDRSEMIREELIRAGLAVVYNKQHRIGEVAACVAGEFATGRKKLIFTRSSDYWVVTGKIPLKVIEEIRDDPIGKADVHIGGGFDPSFPSAPWLEYYNEKDQLLLSLSMKAEIQQKALHSKTYAAIFESLLVDPGVEFVEDPADEGEAHVTLCRIYTEEGLRLFSRTIKRRVYFY